MGLFSKFAALLDDKPPPPRGRSGEVAYAVGDIHGRLDLLDLMIAVIGKDAQTQGRPARLIFLGDYIDRGPASAGVLERLTHLQMPGIAVTLLAGNHEEALLRIIDGDHGYLGDWLSYGGDACVRSYGLDPRRLREIAPEIAAREIRAAVPASHQAMLRGLEDSFTFGDYVFAHAGVRPGIPIPEQNPSDLRWIREGFLDSRKHYGYVVVHGHTIVTDVEHLPNRVAIDTGAYRTGKLSAVVIRDDELRVLRVEQGGTA